MEFEAQIERLAEALADEIRVEMARQRRTATELAPVIGVSAHTAGRRLNGAAGFNVFELFLAAAWLGTTADVLIARAYTAAQKEPAA